MDLIIAKDFNTKDYYVLNDTTGCRIYCESEEEAKRIVWIIEKLGGINNDRTGSKKQLV